MINLNNSLKAINEWQLNWFIQKTFTYFSVLENDIIKFGVYENYFLFNDYFKGKGLLLSESEAIEIINSLNLTHPITKHLNESSKLIWIKA